MYNEHHSFFIFHCMIKDMTVNTESYSETDKGHEEKTHGQGVMKDLHQVHGKCATKTMHDFNRAAKPALPVPPTSHALFEASSAEPRKANLKGYAPLSQRSDWQHLGICWFKTLVKTLLVNYQWESKMTPRGGISCPRELPRVFLGPEL